MRRREIHYWQYLSVNVLCLSNQKTRYKIIGKDQKTMKHNYLAIISISLLLVCCNDKAAHTDYTPSNAQNTLRVDIGMEPPTLDPALAEDSYTFRVINDLFAGLVDWNQSNQPIPGMASSWSISADGTTYLFHLRHDLKFSDGQAIHAADFVYSWRRLVNPKTASPYNFLLKSVVNAPLIMQGKLNPQQLGVRALNDYDFEVKLAYPNTAFLSYITVPSTFVVPQHIIEKYGKEWTSPKHIVTSGAYVLTEHVLNGHMRAVQNKQFYAASQVHINSIEYFPYMDINVSLANFKTGALDTTWQNVPVDQYQRLRQQYPNELHTVLWERIEYLVFNMQLAKYANNPKLRQALSMALDRDVLVSHVLKSGQRPLYSVVSSTIDGGRYASLQYNWSHITMTERIKKAQQLYKEAGFSDKNPFKLTLSYRNNDLYKKVALSLAAMWSSNLGVKTTINAMEWKSLIQSLHKGDYDIAFAGWGADYNSITTYTPLYLCSSPNNYTHYCNNNYDQLINLSDKLTDSQAQQASYQAALTLILNSYATIPLYQPTHQRLVQQRVNNYNIRDNYLDNVQSKWFSLSPAL